MYSHLVNTMWSSRRPGLVLTITVLVIAVLMTGPPAQAKKQLPFKRTETREDCADLQPLRKPLFGELHIHTTFSIDAVRPTRATIRRQPTALPVAR
jgi:hypothetical protein